MDNVQEIADSDNNDPPMFSPNNNFAYLEQLPNKLEPRIQRPTSHADSSDGQNSSTDAVYRGDNNQKVASVNTKKMTSEKILNQLNMSNSSEEQDYPSSADQASSTGAVCRGERSQDIDKKAKKKRKEDGNFNDVANFYASDSLNISPNVNALFESAAKNASSHNSSGSSLDQYALNQQKDDMLQAQRIQNIQSSKEYKASVAASTSKNSDYNSTNNINVMSQVDLGRMANQIQHLIQNHDLMQQQQIVTNSTANPMIPGDPNYAHNYIQQNDNSENYYNNAHHNTPYYNINNVTNISDAANTQVDPTEVLHPDAASFEPTMPSSDTRMELQRMRDQLQMLMNMQEEAARRERNLKIREDILKEAMTMKGFSATQLDHIEFLWPPEDEHEVQNGPNIKGRVRQKEQLVKLLNDDPSVQVRFLPAFLEFFHNQLPEIVERLPELGINLKAMQEYMDQTATAMIAQLIDSCPKATMWFVSSMIEGQYKRRWAGKKDSKNRSGNNVTQNQNNITSSEENSNVDGQSSIKSINASLLSANITSDDDPYGQADRILKSQIKQAQKRNGSKDKRKRRSHQKNENSSTANSHPNPSEKWSTSDNYKNRYDTKLGYAYTSFAVRAKSKEKEASDPSSGQNMFQELKDQVHKSSSSSNPFPNSRKPISNKDVLISMNSNNENPKNSKNNISDSDDPLDNVEKRSRTSVSSISLPSLADKLFSSKKISNRDPNNDFNQKGSVL